jgi:hypothetical protein
VIYGGRLLFIYGTLHWFPVPLGQFMAAHQLSAAGLTDALIFMAVAMALARSALLSGVGGAAAPPPPASPPGRARRPRPRAPPGNWPQPI